MKSHLRKQPQMRGHLYPRLEPLHIAAAVRGRVGVVVHIQDALGQSCG